MSLSKMKYWNAETPLEAAGGNIALQYFRKARILHVCKGMSIDSDGVKKFGRVVALPLNTVAESEELSEIFLSAAAEVERYRNV